VPLAENPKPETLDPKLLSARPLLGQIFPKLFVVRVVAMLNAQARECRDDFFLADFQRIGDHTRGLFEAHASIAMSAAHALKHVYVLVVLHKPFANYCFIQVATPEKPIFCAVISSTTVFGCPSESATTRTRIKMRQGSSDFNSLVKNNHVLTWGNRPFA
jgi:hypothetical protein